MKIKHILLSIKPEYFKYIHNIKIDSSRPSDEYMSQ